MTLQAERTYKITAQDKDTFNRDGYWISPKLLDDDQIERLRLRMNGFGLAITTAMGFR